MAHIFNSSESMRYLALLASARVDEQEVKSVAQDGAAEAAQPRTPARTFSERQMILLLPVKCSISPPYIHLF